MPMITVKSRSEAIRIAKTYGYVLSKKSFSEDDLKLNCRLLAPHAPSHYVGALHQYHRNGKLILHIHPL